MSFTVDQIAHRLGLEEPTAYKQKREKFLFQYGAATYRRTGATTARIVQALAALSREARWLFVATTHREAERCFEVAAQWVRKLLPACTLHFSSLTIRYGTGELRFCGKTCALQTWRGARYDAVDQEEIDTAPLQHLHRVGKNSRMCIGCSAFPLRGKALSEARYRRALLRENAEMADHARHYDETPNLDVRTRAPHPCATHRHSDRASPSFGSFGAHPVRSVRRSRLSG